MFSPLVEFWRSYFEQSGTDLPIEFILDWIQRESGGNPCSYTTYHESGILQLMPPHDTDAAGTTEDALRTMCIPGTGQMAKPIDQLSDEEIHEQVWSSIVYVNNKRALAHQLLHNVGTDWSESTANFWSLVKLLHSLPSLTDYLPVAAQQLSRGPANWDEFIQFVPQSTKNDHWLKVSSDIGAYGAGGGKSRAWVSVLLFGSLAVGAWLAHRRAHRRIGHGL
jgi:hypothetical protein